MLVKQNKADETDIVDLDSKNQENVETSILN
jgi:hypothetical protein